MTVTELVAALVRSGHASVDADERLSDWQREAAHAAFDHCLTLHTFDDFARTRAELSAREVQLRQAHALAGPTNPTAAETTLAADERAERVRAFWRHRWFAAQIEFVHNVLYYAAKLNQWPEAEQTPAGWPTARAAMAYAAAVATPSPE
jgi:hypothetical protein